MVTVWLFLGFIQQDHAKKPKTPPKPPAVEVTVDVSQTPDLATWADEAKKLVEEWYPKIEHILERRHVPGKVTLKFDPSYDGVAATGGSEITISPAWVRKHPEDKGMVVHELTHVVQGYPNYDPSWLVEGIADWVRYFRFEPKKIGPPSDEASYKNGYGTAARFLDWAAGAYDKHLIVRFDSAMRFNRYSPGLWQNYTGKTLDELWATYVKASAWQIGPFSRPAGVNPVLKPDETSAFHDPMTGHVVNWEHDHAFNPAAIVKDGQVVVLYRAEDNSGQGIGGHTSRVGYASSSDGLHFEKRPEPVVYPADDAARQWEWPGGCEDPRIVQAPNGEYVLMYTAWDRKTARLSVATSKDLLHWTKYGPAFKGSMEDKWSKSGSIVTKMQGGRLVAAKIHGLYWMYFGEGTVNVATSPDLVQWTPIIEPSGELLPLLKIRPKRFDSDLVEPGPPALLTKKGIVFLYNGKNAAKDGDPSVGKGAYSAGEALIDADDPTHVLARTTKPFLKPEEAFEKTGQYAAGTVFIEGLVPFKGRWFLYFGTADSFVGVATAPVEKAS